jgi:hypothetical protein
LHNKVIELLRAIYCDSSSILVTSTSGSVDVNGTFSSLDSFLNSFEFNLLPPEENYEKEEKQKFEDEGEEIIEIEMSPNTRKFNTSIENLGFTPSEEALISEAMRNPIHVNFYCRIMFLFLGNCF